ncbi:hypothetical protein GCM10023318_56460 [Nocardia callitridis]|uniref:Secreted protein n=1 Tax=Nocardia callitridis TaxID=648753 RepID=A0ABP9L0M6_9NOCA
MRKNSRAAGLVVGVGALLFSGAAVFHGGVAAAEKYDPNATFDTEQQCDDYLRSVGETGPGSALCTPGPGSKFHISPQTQIQWNR